MAIPKFNDDLNIISKLGDNPGSDDNLSTDAFRAKFDEAGLKIQQYLNDVLIPEANQAGSPTEGLTMKGAIDMNGQALTGLKTPEADTDAVTKEYADTKQAQHQNRVVTLSASKWSNNRQTVSVSGIKAEDTVFSTPDIGSREMYAECNIRLSEQDDGVLTYVCEEVPAENLTVNVTYLPFSGAGVTGGSSSGGSSSGSGSTGGGNTGGTGGGLPSVTTADNGKFLRVVDGAWAAAAVPSAEGVSF